jgi:hypothetical protein
MNRRQRCRPFPDSRSRFPRASGSRLMGLVFPSRPRHNLTSMDRFTQNDPERQANIAFVLIFLGIIAVGALTIWLFYGAQF